MAIFRAIALALKAEAIVLHIANPLCYLSLVRAVRRPCGHTDPDTIRPPLGLGRCTSLPSPKVCMSHYLAHMDLVDAGF